MVTVAAVLAGVFVSQGQVVQGYVFEDTNRNLVRDAGERGVSGVVVSDQVQVVRTGADGRWQMALRGDDVRFFVVKPRNWMTPVNGDQLPQFYYIHKPGGSPKSRFAGVAPTGPLPSSVDFPLYRSQEPDKFEALFFGDPQPRDVREAEYVKRDVVEPLVGKTDARFGVTLGDIVFDDLSVFEPLVKAVAMLKLPWYNVIGNHDLNLDSRDDEHSDETFERYFGPNYYSFDHGPVHFVVLDNVHFSWGEGAARGSYTGTFGAAQIEWLEKDLAQVPANKLVVLGMHIPVNICTDREALFRVIESRRFCFSVAAHTHYQEHMLLSDKEGWKGENPHHHVVNVTVSGSWWSGSADENGIPHTTMRCGAPNGYAVFRFDGNQYGIEFRAARRLPSYQMEIHAPDSVGWFESKDLEVLVNVFGGSVRSKVEVSFGDSGKWTAMEKVVRKDPGYEAVVARDSGLVLPFRTLPAAIDSPHLWSGRHAGRPLVGMLQVHVRTTDMFGQTFYATRGVMVR